ncbi:MAG: CPBP family intramembrane metalloprotease [Candidatus Dadabacteria bacterium]|nr:MAG: CPBP family intramembrane metalloprotease [Candidatus Dadabacteria bacterium]
MANNISTELKNLIGFLKNWYNEIVVICFATLFMILHSYREIENFWISSFIYFGIFPVLTILIFLRKNPLDFGLRLGNYRLWLPYILIFLAIAIPILYFTSDMSSVQGYYRSHRNFDLLKYVLQMGVYMLGWEFLFRGFMLFGLKEKFKEGSIIIQMIPFVLLHFGKPEIETISTIFTGLLWGYICYRGKSFWPAYIMHIVVNISNKAFVLGLV